MKLIFYKGLKGNLLDKLICIWTLGPFSHVELVVDENDKEWFAYSSSPREKRVRWKWIPKTTKWTVVDLSVLDLNKNRILEIADNEKGKKYDYISILLTFLLPFNLQSRKKWFCSEICAYLLIMGGLPIKEKPHKIHPNKLFKIINRIIKEQKSLKNED